jgi:hypothetical protein
VLASNLAELDAVLPAGSHPYRSFLTLNAQTAYNQARNGELYDVSWQGPYRNATMGTQASAVGLLVGAIY